MAQLRDSDFDEDGLTNVQEPAAGTDPQQADIGGDGLSDGHELALSLAPLRPEPVLVGHYTFEGEDNAALQNHGLLGGVAEARGEGIQATTDLESPGADGPGVLAITARGSHLDTRLHPFQMGITEGDFTMAAWGKPTERPYRATIVSQPAAGGWFIFFLEQGQPVFYHNRSGGGRALSDECLQVLAAGGQGADTDADGLPDFQERMEAGTLALSPDAADAGEVWRLEAATPLDQDEALFLRLQVAPQGDGADRSEGSVRWQRRFRLFAKRHRSKLRP